MNEIDNNFPLPLSGIETPKAKETSIRDIVRIVKEWWKYVLSKWILIGVACGIGGVIGLYNEWYERPIYKARITFVLENAKSSEGGELGGFASQFGLSFGASAVGETFSGANLYELMSSRTMIQKALMTPVNITGKTETLAEIYIDIKRLRRKWKKFPKLLNTHFLPGADPNKFTLEQNSLMNGFCKTISKADMVVGGKKGGAGFSFIEFTSEDEIFSKVFVEIILKVVSDFYVATKTKKSMENFLILQSQADSTRKTLNSAFSAVASSVDANPNANPALSQTLKVPSQRKQIDVQAGQAAYLQLISNLESAKITLRKETPLIQVIDPPVLPLPYTEPNRKTALMYGAIFGGLIGIAVLILRRLFLQALKGNPAN